MILIISAFLTITGISFFQADSLLVSAVNILPESEEVGAWIRNDEIQIFTEDSLPGFSPGIIRVITEYGLVRLITGSYSDKSDQKINVRVHFMEDNGGAYGLYSVSRTAGGVASEYGDESYRSESNIHIWKGNYYINIYSDEGNGESAIGMCLIASAFENNIDSDGTRPEITNLMPEEGFVTETTRYFRGPAGLNMHLPFDYFGHDGFEEGVYSDFGQHKLVIFKLSDFDRRIDCYEKIIASIKGHKRYKLSHENGDYDRFTDQEGENLIFGNADRYIMVYIGKDLTRQPELFEKIEDSLTGEPPGMQEM